MFPEDINSQESGSCMRFSLGGAEGRREKLTADASSFAATGPRVTDNSHGRSAAGNPCPSALPRCWGLNTSQEAGTHGSLPPPHLPPLPTPSPCRQRTGRCACSTTDSAPPSRPAPPRPATPRPGSEQPGGELWLRLQPRMSFCPRGVTRQVSPDGPWKARAGLRKSPALHPGVLAPVAEGTLPTKTLGVFFETLGVFWKKQAGQLWHRTPHPKGISPPELKKEKAFHSSCVIPKCPSTLVMGKGQKQRRETATYLLFRSDRVARSKLAGFMGQWVQLISVKQKWKNPRGAASFQQFLVVYIKY